jgi:hypothetical protein
MVNSGVKIFTVHERVQSYDTEIVGYETMLKHTSLYSPGNYGQACGVHRTAPYNHNKTTV